MHENRGSDTLIRRRGVTLPHLGRLPDPCFDALTKLKEIGAAIGKTWVYDIANLEGATTQNEPV